MMDWDHGNYGGGAGLGMLLMFVVWIAIIGVAIWAVARLTRSGTHQAVGPEHPMAILDRRFANGEVDAQEYAQARRILQGKPIDPIS